VIRTRPTQDEILDWRTAGPSVRALRGHLRLTLVSYAKVNPNCTYETYIFLFISIYSHMSISYYDMGLCSDASFQPYCVGRDKERGMYICISE
jgi:hypothetical protein